MKSVNSSNIIGYTSIVVAIIIAISSIYFSYHIAYKSGSFKSPSLELKIGDVILEERKEINLFIGANGDAMKNDVVLTPITLEVKNTGDTVLTNTYVTYRYNSILDHSTLNKYLGYEVVGGAIDSDITRSTSSSEPFDYITYKLPNINPNVAIGINEPFVLNETIVTDEVRLELDQVVIVPYSVRYSINYQVTVSSTTDANSDYQFNVNVIASNDINDLQDRFVQESLVPLVKKLREESSFFEYFLELVFGNNEHQSVLVYPKFQQVKLSDGSIFMPKSENDVLYRTATYKLASWKYLL